jgi:F-type H+-transporting ATPase subunit epsilon
MMRLKIITPERVLVDQDVEAVYGMAVDGSIGILPKHIPMVTPLAVGLLSYVQGGQKQPLAVMGGMLYTDGQTVTVLSDAAELGSEINVARAQQAKERAEAELRQKHDNLQEGDVSQALSRAVTRLKAARH